MTDILTSPDLRAQIFLVEFRYDAESYRYTNSPDEDVSALSSTFIRKIMSVTKLASSATEDAGDTTIVLPSDDPVVQIYDSLLPTSPVACTIYSMEVNDPDRKVKVRKSGEVGAVNDKDDGTTELTVRPIAQGMNRAIPWQLQSATCSLVLYGVQCTVNAELYRTQANRLLTLDPTFVQANEFDTTDPTWFKAGWVRCRRTKELRFILDQQAAGKLMLSYPFTKAVVGDIFDAWAGCMRTGSVCSDKFHNKINAIMFEKIPQKNMWTSGIK